MLRKQIEGLVESIRNEISLLHKAIHHQIDANAQEHSANRSEIRNITGIGASIANSAKSQADTAEANQKEASRQQERLISTQKWMTRWTFLAFGAASATAVGAFVYAHIAARQACIMQQTFNEIKKQTGDAERTAKAGESQAQTAGQQIQMDQRPWLKFQFSEENRTLHPGEPLRVPINFLNVGKTAAEKISWNLVVDILPIGKDPIFPINHFTPKNPSLYKLPPVPNSRMVIVPGIEGVTSIIFPGDRAGTFDVTPMQLVKGNPRHAVPAPVSPEVFASLGENRSYVVIYGEIFYLDVFGVTHWTKFCAQRVLNGEMNNLSTACVNFASVDNNYK